ncbi:hypothetical protein Y032_0235g3199 [Ancylostoma ceylanicum]|uniref:Uncharacterized protein n=1 Tax=Ancylostoma ceylanicum TaxID=53326 RepID=A0A016SEQ9_9BILA|nr:hypothetical protein Y032_0235g3199 [Ancylostoma ceylanicum]
MTQQNCLVNRFLLLQNPEAVELCEEAWDAVIPLPVDELLPFQRSDLRKRCFFRFLDQQHASKRHLS